MSRSTLTGHRSLLRALPLAAVLLAAACGSDDNTAATTATSGATATTSAPTTAASDATTAASEATTVASATADSTATSTATTAPAALDTDHPFVIGVIAAQTGPFAAVGAANVAGFQVGADRANARGGILGREVQIEVRDSAADPQKAVLAANDFMDNVKPDALYASGFSTEALAILPLTTQRGIFTISAASAAAAADVTAFPRNFTMGVPTQPVAAPIACVAKTHGDRVALLSTSDAGAVDAVNVVAPALEAQGITIVARESFAPDATDITAVLTKLRAENPDSIVMQTPGTSLGTVMNGLQAIAWDVPVVGTPGTVTANLQEMVPGDVSGQFSAVVSHVQARQNPDELDADLSELIAELGKYNGNIVAVSAAIIPVDIVTAIQWGFDNAKSSDPADVTAALEHIGEADVPAGLFFNWPNPNYTPDNHSVSGADFSNYWFLVKVSKPLVGTYVGERVAPC